MKREDDEVSPKLLDLISGKNGDWFVEKKQQQKHAFSEEKKLELSLCPPGYFYADYKPKPKPSFMNLRTAAAATARMEAGVETPADPPPKNNTTVATTNKRIAAGPVVGWPPIRSFRKNFSSGNPSKSVPNPDSDADGTTCRPSSPKNEETPPQQNKSMFVKINMEGIPIGRKIDLQAYDGYEKLKHAVDELFKGLVAAQKSDGGETKAIGEYALVYEDNEGDRMLVGDVPWNMFVSTAKRLRVLRTSELTFITDSSAGGRRSSKKHGEEDSNDNNNNNTLLRLF